MSREQSSWIWGLVYCNRRDVRLLVPLRCKLGWALNFGHPRATTVLGWICALGLLALLVVPIVAHPSWFARRPSNLIWVVSANLAALGLIRLNGWFGWSDYRLLSAASFGVIATGIGFAIQGCINGPLVLWWAANKLSWTHYLVLAPVAAIAQTFGRWAALMLLVMARPAPDRASHIRYGLLVGLGFTVWEITLVYFSGSWAEAEFGLLSVWERVSASMFHIYAGGLVALAIYARRYWPIVLVVAIHSWMDFFTGGVAEVLGMSLYGLETMFSACAVATWAVFLLAAGSTKPGDSSVGGNPRLPAATPSASPCCLAANTRP